MKKSASFLMVLILIYGNMLAQEEMSTIDTQSPRLNMPSSENIFGHEPTTPLKSFENRMLGDCNIGNETDPGWTPGNFAPDYILGVKFSLSEQGTIYSMNMIGNNSGSNMQMAVYDDNAGVPNDLIVSSGITTVGSGVVTLNITPMVIPQGDYWIMAIYEQQGDHSNVDQMANSNTVYYTTVNFGDPLPANASGFLSYVGQDFLYFLDIECEIVGFEDNLEDLISIYPNPIKDILNISLPPGIEIQSSTMYDITGQDIETTLDNGILNTSHLTAGFYLLELKTSEGNVTKKIIKN